MTPARIFVKQQLTERDNRKESLCRGSYTTIRAAQVYSPDISKNTCLNPVKIRGFSRLLKVAHLSQIQEKNKQVQCHLKMKHCILTDAKLSGSLVTHSRTRFPLPRHVLRSSRRIRFRIKPIQQRWQ